MRILMMTAAGVLSLSAMALAQDLTSGDLAAVDGNQDGAVAIEELNAVLARAFAQIDADGNGEISVTEVGTIMTPEQFAGADADGDGAIDKAEFDAQVQRDFAAADKDGDGALD